MIIISSSQWKQIHLWIAGGALYGLLWGVGVALLMALLQAAPALEMPWATAILSRTQIGALAGCFFGTLAGLIFAREQLSLESTLLNGRSTLLLLGTFALWLGSGLLMYEMFLKRLLITIDWVQLVMHYPHLPAIALVALIPLALPPLYMGQSLRTSTTPSTDQVS